MTLKEKLAALYAEADELNKKGEELTEDDIARVDELGTEIDTTEAAVRKADEANARLAKFASGATRTPGTAVAPTMPGEADAPAGSLGDRFLKSAAWKAFRNDFRGPVEGRPINIKADNLGSFNVLRKEAGDPAPIASTVGGGPLATPYRLPGIVDVTYRPPTRLLDLIAHGTTQTPFVQYRQLTAVTNNAAVVPENGIKPLSSLTFNLASAYAYTYADGFKVTNQELADDGIMAAQLNTVLVQDLAHKIEDIVLNGTGSNQPFGILNTTGVLSQPFVSDVPTTLRNAITLLQVTSLTDVSSIVLNPADAQNLSLIKDTQGRYIGNGPFGAANPIIWQIPYVISTKVPAGTALLGDFSTIQLLDLEGLSIQAFNQNEDDARHNLTYIRAEQRSLLLFRQPARICVATLHA